MKNIIGLAIVAITTLSGCASIVSKSSYPVAINSTPDQATFTIKNKEGVTVHSGTTPATVTLKSDAGYFRGETYTINFSKPDYQDQTAILDSSVNDWYFGNLVLGGLTGLLIVDPLTGAMWSLPESLQVNLSQDGRRSQLNTTTNLEAQAITTNQEAK
jgi:uncharacterized protein YceK